MIDTRATKRGPGRPRKPVDPPSAFTRERFDQAMAEADQLEQQTSLAAWHAAWHRRGMNPQAFKLVRKLQKLGPAEARAFHSAYVLYLEQSGVLER